MPVCSKDAFVAHNGRSTEQSATAGNGCLRIIPVLYRCGHVTMTMC